MSPALPATERISTWNDCACPRAHAAMQYVIPATGTTSLSDHALGAVVVPLICSAFWPLCVLPSISVNCAPVNSGFHPAVPHSKPGFASRFGGDLPSGQFDEPPPPPPVPPA